MATVLAMMATSQFTHAMTMRPSPFSVSRRAGSPAFVTKHIQVRCNAEPESKVDPLATPAEGIRPTPVATPIQTPAAPKSKQVSTNFEDVFAFSGPAPETINGRLAMLGFVAALGAELATGESLTTQLGHGGVAAFIFAAVLFTTASLVPLFQGVTAESKSKGFFSSTAETWNGRAAMVGLVALAITEFVNGSPLV